MTQLPDLAPPGQLAPQLAWVESASNLLDTKFRIPGTDIRFGADFLLGLIPGAGDLVSYGFSSILVLTMARHGASPKLAAKMLLNIGLDASVGSIPILGSVFDLIYKANYRNVELMKEYYVEGEHTGSVWPVVIGVLIGLVVILFLVLWLVWLVLDALWGMLAG